MWPRNTADVTTLLPVIDRLRQRFGIGRVCVVGDRGMISAATIAGLEERRLEYSLGACERSDALVKKIVMENDDPLVPLLIQRQRGETQLFAKQVKIEDQRYIVVWVYVPLTRSDRMQAKHPRWRGTPKSILQ